MEDTVQLDIDQRIRELYPTTIYPIEDFQYEKSTKHRRKRRSINPSFMPELRILRRDIRRNFGNMFVNVINSNEISLMARFIGDFFRPDCVVKLPQPHCNAYKKIVQIFDDKSRNSLESFLGGFSISCEMMPDQVVRLLECQVRTKQGSLGSVIVLKTLIKCVQTLTPADALRKSPKVHNLQYDEENHHHSTSSELSLSEEILMSSSINSNSSEYSLNEHHFVQQIHIEDQLISETLLQ